ncbi:MAG: histidine phosphatase family protein [Cloacibacterium sp.]|nr:histidine phosphatase family protein [Cloacibacterium sp.]
MKTIILIRHAKSDWQYEVQDFDRPLAERGHRDAPKMAQYLLQQGIEINQLVSSPANRALSTCKYFAQEYQNTNILEVQDLYDPSIQDFIDTIENLDDRENSVALFSHNNGITYFANSLSNENIQHMPTCAVVGFRANVATWKDFESAKKEFLFFYYPKGVF